MLKHNIFIEIHEIIFDSSFQFYFLINIAVGGTSGFFPDGKHDKPWNATSPSAMKDFWEHRSQWLPSWRNTEKSSLIVDSVKVWAI